ncbi:phage filamentation protein Fil family protein [Enterobacter roggenkampii]|uniref:phage filamentation protein Fil family protein n=1 Tax=Enterobacter roggenkampii TaxID=1812935 RepID=UPI002FFA3069
MLTKEPSFASLLVKQSPAMHYGHGWIHLPGGKKWHPCNELTPRQQAVRGIGKKRSLQRLIINVAGNLRTRRKFFPGS